MCSALPVMTSHVAMSKEGMNTEKPASDLLMFHLSLKQDTGEEWVWSPGFQTHDPSTTSATLYLLSYTIRLVHIILFNSGRLKTYRWSF